ncbi:MAG: SPFH/Band 7/PHB domain protein [Thermoprotei archaeon]|nr:MAG: SPFH/Band 7/PHB domain protein [Thermoprotei archaeon]RLF19124.1 MAG: SPFH/Band 7/PHB domain protein [Thermoprotei archaeon]
MIITPFTLLVLGIVLAIIFSIIASSIRIVPEYERLVVLRMGRLVGVRGPGLVLLIPFIDRGIRVDLREQYIEVQRQTCITKDNAPVDIDLLIYFKVFDPLKSVIEVRDFVGAATGIATTTLRAVVGDIELDEVLAKREYINQVLRTKLDEVTQRWGVKVTSVEIREILPPRDVQEAMIKQMSAERERRAMIIQAEGKREAAIRVAEGEKQAAILKAEGEKQAIILKAEGEKRAAILRAEGLALALEKVNNVALKLDSRTLALQYLDMFRELAASPSTKLLIPMELTSLIEPFKRFITTPFVKEEKKTEA